MASPIADTDTTGAANNYVQHDQTVIEMQDMTGTEARHTGSEPVNPTWKYATHKTIGQGTLTTSTAFGSAMCLRNLLRSGDSDSAWQFNVAILVILILMELVATICMAFLAIASPTTERGRTRAIRLNYVILALVISISFGHVLLTAIGDCRSN